VGWFRSALLATATVEDIGPCKKLLKIAVPAADVTGKINEEFEKLRDSVTVDGFRKGHVPRKLIEKRFGEKVVDEVKEAVMAEASENALNEHGLSLIGEPSFDKIEYKEGSDLSFEVTVEVKPQFDLPEYKGLKVQRKPADVTAQDLAEGLERLRARRATLKPAQGAEVEAADFVVVDWKAECESEEVANETGAQVSAQTRSLGSIEVKGLMDALRGAREGESRTAEVTFPEDHPIEKVRGKTGKATVVVKQILRPVMPELNDEFAKALDFETLDELKGVVEGQLKSRKERDVEEDLQRQITTLLLDQVKIELPEGLIKRQARDYLMRHQLRMRYQGVPDEEIEDKMAEMQAASEEAAQREFKTYFLFEKIAEKEKIFVTENDVENRVAQLANSYRMSVQRMAKQIEEQGALAQLRIQMREEQVMALLVKNAEIQGAA